MPDLAFKAMKIFWNPDQHRAITTIACTKSHTGPLSRAERCLLWIG